MKVNLIRKFRWYIIGFILVTIMLSVSLSFASWDTASLKAKLSQGSSGTYNDMVKLVEDKYLSNGTEGQNNIADVGDIVSFGNYYQTAAATTKDPIRWIVVEKQVGTSGKQELTLLAEKVMAFGSFWNRHYIDVDSNWVWENTSFQQFYQNYMVSTLSMWLNSDYGARHDQGTAFTANASKLAMRGFMNEAFTPKEQDYIIDREISGIQGFAQGVSNSDFQTYTTKSYKVWTPSWSEVYGDLYYASSPVTDGLPNKQFQYFAKGNSPAAKTTAFAATPSKSNYTVEGDTSHVGNSNGIACGSSSFVWWWLRSPYPVYCNRILLVDKVGVGGTYLTSHSYGGVRPAVVVPV